LTTAVPSTWDDTILEYRFDESIKASIQQKAQFESEESNFAPEPSVACRVRAENGCEFALIYLQGTQKLLVFGECGVDRENAIATFLNELPEMSKHLLRELP
jgi:hypothetical protein